MVQEMNADKLSQNFVWYTKDADASQAKKDPNDVLPVHKSKAKDDGQTGTPFYCALTSETSRFGVYSRPHTNSEVRKLLSDFSPIGRELLARSASKAPPTQNTSPTSTIQLPYRVSAPQ